MVGAGAANGEVPNGAAGGGAAAGCVAETIGRNEHCACMCKTDQMGLWYQKEKYQREKWWGR